MELNIVNKPSVEYWPQGAGLDGMFEQIEKCGRICYQSTPKGGESARAFANAMVTSGHLAMLEHGSVYLDIPMEDAADLHPVTFNNYTKSNVVRREDGTLHNCISTNYRVLVENGWTGLLEYWSEPTEQHELRMTAMFNTNIGVSREFNRHRVNSMAESSTRYCNYTKDKFGNAISVVEPTWLRDRHALIAIDNKNEPVDTNENYKDKIADIYLDQDEQWEKCEYWLFAMQTANFCYNNLIRLGCKPQEAREVLPLATNTKLVHTAFVSDWEHFLRLRAFDSPTNHPHPMAKELAEQWAAIMLKQGVL